MSLFLQARFYFVFRYKSAFSIGRLCSDFWKTALLNVQLELLSLEIGVL